MRRRFSKLLKRLLLVLLSTLAGLALAEGVARLLLERPQTARVYQVRNLPTAADEVIRERALRASTKLYIKTKAGRRLRANVEAIIENYALHNQAVTIRTNSIGYRNPEIGEKTRPRVLFLGDSITCGDFLNEEDTFVRRIERLAADTERPFETINAGVGGIGLEDEFAILMESGLATDPDVVVLGFYLNDVQNSPAVEVRRLPAFARWSRLAEYLIRLLPAERRFEETLVESETLAAWTEQMRRDFPPGEGDPKTDPAAFNRLIQESARDWGTGWCAAAWERMEPVFHELRRQSELHDFELLVLCFPVRHQVVAGFLEDTPQRRLAALTLELGIPCLDLLPLMREAMWTDPQELFFDWCHHTPHGQGLIAEWTYRFLRENARVLAGPR